MADPIHVYELRVEGLLEPHWTGWFSGMVVAPTGDGCTLITGPVRDQPELHGVLAKIRDLGLVLVNLRRVEQE